jgi:hypothetical protein
MAAARHERREREGRTGSRSPRHRTCVIRYFLQHHRELALQQAVQDRDSEQRRERGDDHGVDVEMSG